jgi:adenylate kinase
VKKKSLKNKLTIVVLGRTGCGKGTQTKFIVRRIKKLGVRHIVTGDLMRELMKQKGITARRTREVMQEGNRHPSWLAAVLWIKELIEYGGLDKHIVFDGALRGVWEAELADDFMEWHGRSLPIGIYLDISNSEATKRLLKRGRGDDNKKIIRNRLAYFPKLALPVVSYFRKHGRLIYINGEQSVENVWRDIDQALAKRFGKKWPKK